MKKIAWLHSHLLYPNSGGTRYITDFIISLKKNGINIDLFCDQISQESINLLKKNNIRVSVIDYMSTWSAFYWLTLPLRIFFKRNYFNRIRNNYDVFVTSMFPMNLVPQSLNVKTIQICFEPYAFFYDKQFLSQFKLSHRLFFTIMSFIYSKMDKKYTAKSDTIVTVSKFSQNKIMNVYNKKSEIIPASVDQNKYKKVLKERINKFRLKYTGSPLLLHSTDYTGNKSTDYVVRLVTRLKKYFPNIKLLLVYYIQNKKIFNELKRKYDKNTIVTVLNAFPYSQLSTVYSAVDFVIQPNINRSESWPLREALIAKTPIIGGIACEECTSENNSVKIDPTNMSMSLTLVKEFIEKKEYKFGLRSIQNYSLRYNTKKMIRLLNNI